MTNDHFPLRALGFGVSVEKSIDTIDGLLMIDELGLSATVIQETIGSEVARFRFTAAAQSYRELIIGREPTILVISGSQFGNSDV